MKETRQIFILTGSPQNVSKALDEVSFKGAEAVKSDCSAEQMNEILHHNKSVFCSSDTACVKQMDKAPIYIEVVDSDSAQGSTQDDSINCINVSKDNIAQQIHEIADKLNCDIGDHKTNNSDANNKFDCDSCCYCKILRGISKYNQSPIYMSKHFFLMPTLGEFTHEYLLVIPIRHVMSIAALTDEECKDFVDVLEDAHELLRMTYGCEHFFDTENGTGHSGFGKAKDSVVHAHLHTVGVDITAKQVMEKYGMPLKRINIDELSKYGEDSYWLINGENLNSWYVFCDDEYYIPRQFNRQIMGDYLELPAGQWNWREYLFTENMHESSKRIIQCLKDNWDSVPERIKQRTQKYVFPSN